MPRNDLDHSDTDTRAAEIFIDFMTHTPPKGWSVTLRDTARGATYFGHRDGRRFMVQTNPGRPASVTRL